MITLTSSILLCVRIVRNFMTRMQRSFTSDINKWDNIKSGKFKENTQSIESSNSFGGYAQSIATIHNRLICEIEMPSLDTSHLKILLIQLKKSLAIRISNRGDETRVNSPWTEKDVPHIVECCSRLSLPSHRDCSTMVPTDPNWDFYTWIRE